MRIIIFHILLTLGLSPSLMAQSDYKAWLDSMQSESYIGMEVWLDEMKLTDTRDPNESGNFSFYKNNPLNSTEDVMSRLSGISMMRRGNYAWEPTINGLSGGQITVVIDGMRMFGACTDKMDPISSYVEPNNLESISIQKGGSGGVHGSTVGGTVDFKLKRPKFNAPLSGLLSSRYESVAKGLSQSAALNYGKGRWAVRMNAGLRNYQDYTNGEGEQVDHSGYDKFNYSMSVVHRTTPGHLIQLDLLIDHAKDIGYPGLPMDVAFADAKIAALSYTMFQPKPWVEILEMKAYANTVHHLMDDSRRKDLPVRMDMPGQTTTYGAYAQVQIYVARHTLNAKWDGYATRAVADMTMDMTGETPMYMQTWPEVDRQDVGWYMSDRIQWSDRFLTDLNFRVEQAFTQMNSPLGHQQFSIFGYSNPSFKTRRTLLNASVTMQYQWSPAWSSKVQLSYGQRLPSVSEMFGFYLYNNSDGYDYLGRPDIKKESSLQVSAEVKYEPTDQWSLTLDGFHYQFNNYIMGYIDPTLDAMTLGARGVKIYENIEGVVFSGFNAQISYNPSRFLQILYLTKATYARDGTGQPLSLIPPLKNNLTIITKWKDFKLQLEGEWTLAQNRINEAAGEQRTAAYQLIHMRFSRDLAFKNFKTGISLGIENILDKSYRAHLDWGGVQRPGRNFYLSLSARF